MEISGRANPIESSRTSQSQDASGLSGSGAFEYQYLDVNGGILLKDSSLIANYSKRGTLDFKASRNWTGATSSVGGSQAHNNLPPFAVYAIWERIE